MSRKERAGVDLLSLLDTVGVVTVLKLSEEGSPVFHLGVLTVKQNTLPNWARIF